MNEASPQHSALLILQKAFPGKSPQELAAMLVQETHPLPTWSTLHAPQIRTVKTTTNGSFVWPCFLDPRGILEPQVVLVKRGSRGGQPSQFGALGGYMDLGDEQSLGEQPAEGAVREMQEETRTPEGNPVLDMDAKRLQLLVSGVDYWSPSLPVHYTGHMVTLTRPELDAITLHAERIAHDPQYAAGVKKATHGEVEGFAIMPLSKAMALPPEAFAYTHEFAALQQLSERLSAQKEVQGRIHM